MPAPRSGLIPRPSQDDVYLPLGEYPAPGRYTALMMENGTTARNFHHPDQKYLRLTPADQAWLKKRKIAF